MNEITTSNNSIDNTINTITTTKKQRKSPARAKKDKLPLIAFTDKEKQTCINLDSEFKWTQSLTDAQRLFVFYYCNQALSKRNAAEAARLAGYSEKTANVQAKQLLMSPHIIAEIKNINSQLLKNLTKLNLENTIKDIIERKRERAMFNPIDVYDIEETTTPEGVRYVRGDVKPKSELTEKQKRMILGVKFEGQRGIVNYVTPDVAKEENDLINIYSKLFDKKDESGNDFDIETTAEIIGEKLQVKTKVIKQNRETAEMSELAAIGAITREEED